MIGKICCKERFRIRGFRVHVPICTFTSHLASFSHLSFSPVISTRTKQLPVALTIAGSDSSSGAGIQADLKTFAAHNCYAVNAVTAIVAESPGSVSGIELSDSTLLNAQLNRVAGAFPISAAKTGMLGNRSIVESVADFFEANPDIALVIDPVLRASAGASLLDEEGLDLLVNRLIPLSTLITPNLAEAETLSGRRIDSSQAMADTALEMSERFGCSVLIKGGHFEHELFDDVIADRAAIHGAIYEFSDQKLELPDLHGTGCTLSAAIAAHLAHGNEIVAAIKASRAYLRNCMTQHHAWGESGDGIRALNHFPDQLE